MSIGITIEINVWVEKFIQYKLAMMFTRPKTYEAEAEVVTYEAKTSEVEAKTEARVFGLEAEAEFEAKFMTRQIDH